MNAKFCGALFIGKGALPLPVREAPSPLFYVLHLFADLFDLVFEGEGGACDL